MRKTLLCAVLLTGSVAAWPLAALAQNSMQNSMSEHMTEHLAVQNNALKWGPAPPGLPPGAQIAVVSGDPSKSEPYVVRAKLPRGYKIPPHTHPTDENVTVLSGTFHIAMGDKFDTAKGETVRGGGFFRAAQGMQHYGWVTGPTMIQIHGMGPFQINYVNPADDPRNKPSAQK